MRPPVSSIRSGIAVFAILLAGLIATVAGSVRQESRQQTRQRTDWRAMMPPGAGREYVVSLCNQCHSVARLALHKKNEARWRGFLLSMNTAATTSGELCACTGGPLDAEEVDIIAGYLSGAFGPENPIDQLPLNANTASPAALARLPGLGPEDVERVVAARRRARFANRRDLERVIGTVKFRQIAGFVDVRDSSFRLDVTGGGS